MSERLIRADGLTSTVRRSGSGPIVVVLGGGPGADPAYLEDLGGLDESVELAVLHARGTGASDPPASPAGYAFDRQAEDVEALRAHLGLERLLVVAHSAGCATALVWAAQHPGHVAGLVLVAPPDVFGVSGVDDVSSILEARSGEPWHAAATDALAQLRNAPVLDEVEGLLAALGPIGYARWTARERAHAALMRPADPVIPNVFWDISVDAESILESLASLQAPVLSVTGSLDAAVGVTAGAAWARRLGGTHVDLPGVAHVPWVDDPRAFREVVLPFVVSVAPASQ